MYGILIVFAVYMCMQLLTFFMNMLFSFAVDLTTSGALLVIICVYLIYRHRGKLVDLYMKNKNYNLLKKGEDNNSNTYRQESMGPLDKKDNVDSNKKIIICPHCSQENRVQINKLNLAAVCGKCKKSLSKLNQDNELNSINNEKKSKKIIVTCPHCFQQNNVIAEYEKIAICGNCKKSMNTLDYQSHDSDYRIQDNPIRVRLTGVTFENRQEIIKELNRSTEIFLKRDMENSHDPYAVAIYVQGSYQIGWIPKQYSKTVSKMIDEGNYKTRILNISGGNNGLNYGVEIEVRLLKNTIKGTSAHESEDWGDRESVSDEYDEDGVPYTNYPDYEDSNYHYRTESTNADETDYLGDQESVWDEYDEDGLAYNDSPHYKDSYRSSREKWIPIGSSILNTSNTNDGRGSDLNKAELLGVKFSEFLQGENQCADQFGDYLQENKVSYLQRNESYIQSEIGIRVKAVDFTGRVQLNEYSDAEVVVAITFLPEMISFHVEDIDYLTEDEKIIFHNKDYMFDVAGLENCRIMDIGQGRIIFTARYYLLNFQYNSSEICRLLFEILTKADRFYYLVRNAGEDNL